MTMSGRTKPDEGWMSSERYSHQIGNCLGAPITNLGTVRVLQPPSLGAAHDTLGRVQGMRSLQVSAACRSIT